MKIIILLFVGNKWEIREGGRERGIQSERQNKTSKDIELKKKTEIKRERKRDKQNYRE